MKAAILFSAIILSVFTAEAQDVTYTKITTSMDWNTCKSTCTQKGLAMATIYSAAENARAISAASDNAWISFNCINTGRSFVWDGAADPTSVPYTNWNVGEPNNSGGEQCTHIFGSGLWNDLACSANLPCLCQSLRCSTNVYTTAAGNAVVNLGLSSAMDAGNPPATAFDTSANWIWYTAGAIQSAPVNSDAASHVYFYTTVSVAASTAVTISYTCDDVAILSVNGGSELSRVSWASVQTTQTTLPAGSNVLMFEAYNGGGPAGFRASVTRTSDGVVLTNTVPSRNNWYWTQGTKPTLIKACPCPAGKFSRAFAGDLSCYDCPAGTFTATTGNAACTQCAAGLFSTAVGASLASTCVSCPAGTYSTSTGASSCGTGNVCLPQYVYVTLGSAQNSNPMLNLAMVQVYSSSGTLITGNTATQSSTWRGSDFPAANCVDDSTGTFCLTENNKNGSPAWLQVKLPTAQQVGSVLLTNRQDCCQEVDVGATVSLYTGPDATGDKCGSWAITAPANTYTYNGGSCPVGQFSAAGATGVSDCKCKSEEGFTTSAGTAVVNLGAASDMANGSSASSGFDTSANWIWYLAGAIQSAPANSDAASHVYFYTTVNVPTSTAVRISFACDDVAILTINGGATVEQVNWANAANYAYTLPAGSSVLMFESYNGGGPAGFRASVTRTSDGAVLTNTGSSFQRNWYWTQGTKPTISKACGQCAAGKDASNNCADCAAGKYSATAGSTCAVCESGKYQALTGHAICPDCASGSFSATSGATSCTFCGAGKFATSNNSATCASCAAGWYSSGMHPCARCAAGTYQGAAGLPDSCTFCEAGKYEPNVASAGCTLCSAGKYSGIGAITCIDCSAGLYSAQGSKSCTSCLAGKYQVLPGQPECPSCEIGKFQPLTGSTSCSNCVVGQYANVAGSTSCQSCVAGQFSPSVSLACNPCGAGTYSFGGAAACSPCAAGSYSIASSTSCRYCSSGNFSSAANSSTCQACSPGTYSVGSSTSGSTSCTSCASGSYSGSTAGSCTSCQPGWSAAISGRSVCDQCSPGTYASSTGTVTCSTCAAGTYAAGPGLTACTICPSGKYRDIVGATQCYDCAAGQYSNVIPLEVFQAQEDTTKYATAQGSAPSVCAAYGAVVATTAQVTAAQALGADWCSSGWVSDSNTPIYPITTNLQTGCGNGAAGVKQYLPPGNVAQVNCFGVRPQQGTQKILPFSASLWSSPQSARTVGQTTCVNCGVNTFSGAQSSQVCTVCPVGMEAKLVGSSTCDPSRCPVGTYKLTATGKCMDCIPGTYTGQSGAENNCVQCEVGKFNNATAQSTCSGCAAGKFAANLASTSCTNCASGSVSSGLAPSTCAICPAGKIAIAAGVTDNSIIGNKDTCDSCGAGKYAATASSTICSDCAVGTVSVAAASGCTGCVAGQYQVATGASTCLVCNSGTYKSAIGAGTCTPCDVGTISVASSASCTQCVAGQYQPSTGSSTCSACSGGKYSAAGASGCTGCQPGTTGVQAGGASCTPCAAGTYSSASGSLTCITCLADTFSAGAASACTPCPANTMTNNAVGSTACLYTICGAGHYATVGSTVCIACVPGKYAHAKATSCTLCPAGTAQPKSAESSCPTCPIGSSNNPTGTVTCSPTLLMSMMEAAAQSSTAELAVGAVAALAVVGTVLAGVVVALKKVATPSVTSEEMQPLFSKV